MSVNPYIEVVCGVKVDKSTLTKLRNINRNEFLFNFLEEYKNHVNCKKEGSHYRDAYDYILNPFVVRDKDRQVIEPIHYHWDVDAKEKEELTKEHFITTYLEKWADKGYKESLRIIENINIYYEDFSLVGITINREYSGICWNLVEFFKASNKPVIKKYDGKRPWEVGVEQLKKGSWHIFNPMWITWGGRSITDAKKILEENGVSFQIYGFISKDECILHSKKMWDVLCKDYFPYYHYRHELWGWGESDFKRLEIMLAVLDKIYDIHLDKMNMDRYMIIGWS